MTFASSGPMVRGRRRYWRRRDGGPRDWLPHGYLLLAGLGMLFLYGSCAMAPAVERQTAEQVGQALLAKGIDSFELDASGQNVSVSVSDSPVSAAELENLVANVRCATPLGLRVCPNDVEVIFIDAETGSIDPGRPHDLSFIEADGGIVLRGEVPDAASRIAIVTAAQARYATVTDELAVSNEAATEAFDWAVDRAWPLLAALEEGRVSWQSSRLSASGAAANTDVRALFETTAYESRLGSLELPQPGIAARCNERFAAALGRSTIQFQSSSSQISSASSALLDELAQLAGDCPVGLEIAGHTDDTGSAEGNRALSLARAQAVRNALISRGVAAERLNARGYGEVQPVASNATLAGRAQNRRIEIKAMDQP